MTRLRLRSAMVVVVLSLFTSASAHARMMLDFYVIHINDDYELTHYSQDAFRFVGPKGELFLIDPVWDHMQITAYATIPEMILFRAKMLNDKEDSKGSDVYFIVTTANSTCEGPLEAAVLNEKLAKANTASSNIAWIVPQDPNPGLRIGMSAMLIVGGTIFVACQLSGFILPIPFLILLWRCKVLQREIKQYEESTA